MQWQAPVSVEAWFAPYKRYGLVAKNIEENGHTPKHPLGMFFI